MHISLFDSRHRKWFLLGLAACLVCCLAAAALLFVFQHGARVGGSPLLSSSASTARVSQGLDPTMLFADPASYDTRPCATHPSAATCNGKYPVSPLHVAPSFGAQNGAGACIDDSHQIVENQVLTDNAGNAVGSLQLFWLPRCSSYFGYVSFSFPSSAVQSASIAVQTETSNGFVQWYDQFSQLPPQVTSSEQTGPVAFSALPAFEDLGQQLYSPLIFSQGDPVSAHIDITANGVEYGNFTASYAAGVKQYYG